ncbi:hypothetical protein B0H14DRAFT_3480586 [Mycena olivaceomarginata]|nr:hypothetical protein B0H14DRAFT_3480586 [Mycena olivaceomarginata]
MRRHPQIHPSNAPGRFSSKSKQRAWGPGCTGLVSTCGAGQAFVGVGGDVERPHGARESASFYQDSPRAVGKQGTRKPSQAVDVNETQKRASTPPASVRDRGAGKRKGAWMTAAQLHTATTENGAPCANGGE